MTLYELTGNALLLQNLAENQEIDEQTFLDTMESLQFEIEEKADAYATDMSGVKGDIEAIKAEEKRLADKRRVLENRHDTMKKNLENSMKVMGIPKIKTLLFSFNIQKNPASLKIDDESKIPSTFFVAQPDKLDNAMLKEALKSGEVIEGARLESGESLRIK